MKSSGCGRSGSRAKVLVAFGSCACFGGVNQLKNRFGDLDWVNRTVYGDHPQATREVSPLRDFVPVDLEIFGCPVNKEEVERIVTDLVLGKTVRHPEYPVCMECKANENICLFDLGEPCLGPVTRAGCNAWCPNSRMGCWGCRGPAVDANVGQLEEIMRQHGFSAETMLDRLECFGGFTEAGRGTAPQDRPGEPEGRNHEDFVQHQYPPPDPGRGTRQHRHPDQGRPR